MMNRLIYISALAVLLTMCSNPYQKEIAEIDSTLITLDSARKILSAVDEAILNDRLSKGEEALADIEKSTDSLAKEDAYLIDDFHSYVKAYSRWMPRLSIMKEEIEVIPRQLENLRTDLSKNLIEKEKAREYMNKEMAAATSLMQSIHDLGMGLNDIDSAYQEAEKKVLLLKERLESQNHKP